MYLRIEFPEFGKFNSREKRNTDIVGISNTGMVGIDNTGLVMGIMKKVIFMPVATHHRLTQHYLIRLSNPRRITLNLSFFLRYKSVIHYLSWQLSSIPKA